LPVTFSDFLHYGVRRPQIGPALHELVVLGFAEITKPGRAGNAQFRQPHRFRLTYRHTGCDDPTHEWRRIATMEQAKKLAKELREEGRKKRKSSDGRRTSSGYGRGYRNHGSHAVTTGHGSHPVTTFESFGVGAPGRATFQEAEGETAMMIETTMVGRASGAVEVIHDADRCYGFLRRSGCGYAAWWSGERFDDRYIGEFASKASAIDAVVKAAAGSSPPDDQQVLRLLVALEGQDRC